MPRERKVAYLDWAGDPGVRKVAGTSTHLVVAMVLTTDRTGVEQGLAALRERLQLPLAKEFHFVRAREAVRRKFFLSAVTWPFEAVVLVAPKSVIPDLTSARSGVAVIAAVSGLLVANFPPERLESVRLIVDAPNSRQPEVVQVAVAARRSLRAAGLKRGIDVRGIPADREAGLQLADMLAGAVMKREAGEADYIGALGEQVRILRAKMLL